MFIPNNLLSKLEFEILINEFSQYAKLSITEKRFNNLPEFQSEKQFEDIKNTILHYRYKIENLINISNYNIDNGDKIINKLFDKKSYLEVPELSVIISLFNLFIDFNNIDSDFVHLIAQHIIDIDFIKKNYKYLINLIDNKGEIKNSASKELKRIRQEKEKLEANQDKIISQIIKKYNELLMNDSITLSDNRLVLQVKVSNKNLINGILHSYSDTNKTAFIEPEEFVLFNNSITEIKLQEKQEIKKILNEVKNNLLISTDSLKGILEFIIQIDYINTISKYMSKYNAVYPELSDEIYIKKAYNPILKIIKKEETIPIDIKINKNKSLLITGPNMGGKTVVLKTLGIFSIMIKMGLPILCSRDSKIKFYKNIFIDIGDDQSIEEGISTFASHLINYKNFVDKVEGNTLILLDEIGTGTSIREGGSFAIALIDKFINKKATVVFTSHFDIIKDYAIHNKKISYASMLYNIKENKPIYKLEYNSIGVSGVINLLIKYEFPIEIINNSKEIMGKDYINFNDIIGEYKDKILLLKNEKKFIEEQKKAIDKIKKIVENENKEIKKKYKEIDKKYIQLKEDELIRIRRETEALIKQIRESNGNKNSIKDFKAYIEDEIQNTKKPEEKKIRESNNLSIGDNVILEGDIKGVLEKIFDNRVAVNVNGIIINTDINKIIGVYKGENKEKVRIYENIGIESDTIDVRGKYPEDALFEINNFIDKAIYSGIEQITIIHGHGTGVLKKSIREFLKKSRKNSNFEAGLNMPGGDGITIVNLKN